MPKATTGATATTTPTGAVKSSGTNIAVFAIIGVVILGIVGLGIFLAVRGGSSATSEPETEITLDKSIYEPGEEMEVTYSIVEDIEDTAWIGIMASTTPHGDEDDGDANDISYQYLEGDEKDTITMYAPTAAGRYDVRIYESDLTSGEELGYVSFTVEEVESNGTNNSVDLIFDTYSPGEEFTVYYTTDGTLGDYAWIGIIPSDVEHGDEDTNDAYDSDYEWIDDGTGEVTLTAPDEPGEYDVRMNSETEEVAYVSFTVEE